MVELYFMFLVFLCIGKCSANNFKKIGTITHANADIKTMYNLWLQITSIFNINLPRTVKSKKMKFYMKRCCIMIQKQLERGSQFLKWLFCPHFYYHYYKAPEEISTNVKVLKSYVEKNFFFLFFLSRLFRLYCGSQNCRTSFSNGRCIFIH